MRVLELSLRNYRVFEDLELEIPARVIGVFGPNGAGKCLPGSTRLFDADSGEAIPIERFVRERRKRTLGLRDGQAEAIDVTDWMELGDRETVTLTLQNGASFELAATHPVLTDRGCVPAQDLSPDHWVGEVRHVPACGPDRISVEEAYIIGMLLGDGTLTTTPLLSATERAVVELFQACVAAVFPGCAVRATSHRRARTWAVVSRFHGSERRERIRRLAALLLELGVPLSHYLGANLPRFMRGETSLAYEGLVEIEEDYGVDLFEERCALYGGREFTEWARRLGLLGHVAATKRVPPDILLSSSDRVAALLAGLWITDGWVVPTRPDVALGTNSMGLAQDIRILLLRLGITSTLRQSRRPGYPPNYRVCVTGSGARSFGQIPLVGPKARRRDAMLARLASRRSWPNADLLPPSFNEGLSNRSRSGRARTDKQLRRHAMSRPVFMDFGGDPRKANAQVAWSRVESVRATGRKVACFDISVDSHDHIYLAETLWVHNSSLLEAIQYACYGRTRTSKDQIRTQDLLTDCVVRLAFEHGGRQYEVRRTIKGRNHQTDAELYQGDVQLAAGVTEVDAEIQHLLRMDLTVFRASVFAEQKQLDAFSEVTRGKRKEMVLRLLGIRPVDDARTGARKEARATKENADRLAGSLPDATEQEALLERARASAEEARVGAAAATETLAEGERRAGEARSAFEASDTVRERVERIAVEREAVDANASALEARAEELRTRIERLAGALEELPALEEEHRAVMGAAKRFTAGERAAEAAAEVESLATGLAALPPVDAAEALGALEEAKRARDAADRTATRAESARDGAAEDLEAAEEALARAAEADPEHPCPTCGRPLGDDFEEYVEHCRKAVAKAKRDAQAKGRALKVAEKVLRAAERDLAAATKAAEDLQRRAGERTTVEDRLGHARERLEKLAAPFDGRVPDLEALGADAEREETLGRRLTELRAGRDRLADAEKDLGSAETELRASRARIEELDRETAGLAFDREEHERRRKELDEAEVLVRAARDEERRASDALKGAEGRVRELEAELRKVREIAERVTALRSDARLLDRVSSLLEGFRTFLYGRIMPHLSRDAEALFRELTSAEYEDLRIDADTLAIEIADGGRYFPIERFSGSETDLANLALRVAISMHLSRVSGADVGLMVLDEVLGALDAERKDLFVRAIGRLSSRFHQLFVITHAEQVKDQFPASIEVRKIGRRRSTAALV